MPTSASDLCVLLAGAKRFSQTFVGPFFWFAFAGLEDDHRKQGYSEIINIDDGFLEHYLTFVVPRDGRAQLVDSGPFPLWFEPTKRPLALGVIMPNSSLAPRGPWHCSPAMSLLPSNVWSMLGVDTDPCAAARGDLLDQIYRFLLTDYRFTKGDITAIILGLQSAALAPKLWRCLPTVAAPQAPAKPTRQGGKNTITLDNIFYPLWTQQERDSWDAYQKAKEEFPKRYQEWFVDAITDRKAGTCGLGMPFIDITPHPDGFEGVWLDGLQSGSDLDYRTWVFANLDNPVMALRLFLTGGVREARKYNKNVGQLAGLLGVDEFGLDRFPCSLGFSRTRPFARPFVFITDGFALGNASLRFP
jgi:hypothetical protein